MKTREELITGIRDILTALGVEEFDLSVLDLGLGLGWTPILKEDEFDDNDSFCLTSFDIDGVYSCNCRGNWKGIEFYDWDELPTETIKDIYDVMSEYEGGE